MALPQTPPLLSEDIYKHTVVADYVVKRHVKLFWDCFATWEDPVKEPAEYRVYPLHHSARLVPADKADITRKKRHIRPHGVYSITALAAIRGKGQSVELWTFKLEMNTSWDFRFCFEDLSQAQRWHEQLQQVIEDLRAEAGLPRSVQQSPNKAALGARDSDGVGSVRSSYYHGNNGNARVMLQGHTFSSMPAGLSASSYQEEEEDADLARLLNFPIGTPSTRRYTQRWVPYRHSNGLAIYQHQGQDTGGNEYMVSAIIRGSPGDVLRALLDPGSATTILGPALEAEVLESTPGRQVLRIQLQALGPTASWFRPREAVVQRLLKKEDDGVYVVLFSSIEAADSSSNMPHEGVIEEAEGLGGCERRGQPVRCRVSGGYTISKLAGYRGSASPESLLTCILQVHDMGGWLNRSHRLFRFVDWLSGGAYEAFLERMLLGVMLVRDVVENSRFAVKPQAFTLPDAAEEAAAASAAGEAEPFSTEEGEYKGPSLRTSTFVMRQAASHFNQEAAAAAGAPAGSGAAAAGTTSPFASIAGSPMTSAGGALPAAAAVMRGYPKPSRLASLRLPGSLGSRLSSALPGESVPEGVEEPGPMFQLPSKYYEEIHTPGREAPFKVRGATYLKDGLKVSAGQPVFELLGLEVVDVGGSGPCPHISRYLPSIRRSPKPFLFVFNLMVPGPPTMCCVLVFGSDSHPDALGTPPDDPEDSDWQPFDFLIWRFLHGDDEERRSLFKMIPRIAEGSWVIKQSVGTTPVILGRKLATSFHITPKYVEVAVDVGSSTTAQYVTGMVRGGCRSLVLDLGLVLEGHNSWELPEVLFGAVRVNKLDLAAASKLDDSKEVPLRIIPTKEQQHQQQVPATSSASTTG